MADEAWTNTTHDWATEVDPAHLASIREHPATYAPTGTTHLTLEVLAHVADELASGGGDARCSVTLFPDGSVAIADSGRGTDTRLDDNGRAIRKPVLSTRDLRFFDASEPPMLPDGHPRRGMSVVAALSTWTVHLNRRANGSWLRRYEAGIPVTDLVPVRGDGTTGTTIHFLPAEGLRPTPFDPDEVVRLARAWPDLELRAEVR